MPLWKVKAVASLISTNTFLLQLITLLTLQPLPVCSAVELCSLSFQLKLFIFRCRWTSIWSVQRRWIERRRWDSKCNGIDSWNYNSSGGNSAGWNTCSLLRSSWWQHSPEPPDSHELWKPHLRLRAWSKMIGLLFVCEMILFISSYSFHSFHFHDLKPSHSPWISD